MKQTILASAFLLAFTMTAAGQRAKKQTAHAPKPTPTDWKLEDKPVWKLEDAWNVGLQTGEMIVAMMPQKSLRFSLEDKKFVINIGLEFETNPVRVNGNTVTWRSILINGRPATIKYKGEYYWRYILKSLTAPASLLVGFERQNSNETTDDFVVFGEGTIIQTDWNDDGTAEGAGTVTNHWCSEIRFVIDHVYVFEKVSEEPVYHFDYIHFRKWEREAPKIAEANKP